MNLIDRYVNEVGRRLPEKSRADIEKEIRSTLEDILEDRSAKADRPIDENMTVEVLKEFGHPAKVAASYLPERYLIGPQLYPYFIMVMKISLLVALAVGLVRLSTGIFLAEPGIDTIIQSIVESVLNVAGIAITVLGNVVLVFAIMQWALPNIKEISAEWDPRSLPDQVSKSETVSTPNIIFTIVFMLAGMLIFNFYPQILNIGFFAKGKWILIPFFPSAFFHYLPWLNVLWALQIVQNIILLRKGHWQPATRWFSIVLDFFEIGIIYAIMKGPSIINLTVENLQAMGISDPAAAAGLINLVGACVIFGLIVAVIVKTIQVMMKVYRLLTKDRKISLLTIA